MIATGRVGIMLVSVLSAALPAGAADVDKAASSTARVKKVAAQLQARYERTRDLEADFEQTTTIEGFATPITSSGRVYIKKPGRLRWDYLDPNVEEIYVDKNEVMMYVPEHKQVLVGQLTRMAASQAPLQLLQGASKLSHQFDIRPDPQGRVGEGKLPLLALYPKPSEETEKVRTVTRIIVEVYQKNFFIKTVEIHEISGNVSSFRFQNIKANTGLKDDLFEFKVPEGVAVVNAPALSPP